MIHYQQEEDLKKGRIIGGAATLAYFILIALLLLLVKFTSTYEEEGEGILINFGNMEEAAPGGDLAMNEEVAEMVQPQSQNTPSETDMMTQDFEEAPEAVEHKTETRKPVETAPVEKPREVNKKALFPGRTAGSTATSDGTGQGKGNQGNPAGSPEGSHDGTGMGGSGNSANLSGRSLVDDALPLPDYNAGEGKVIINITVDQQGKVITAVFKSQGSTTNNSTLIAAARKAALQARFNVDENAPISQPGTITYNFKPQ